MSEPSFRPPPDDDLPPLVEESLRNLCNERALSPPDASARRRLRSVGEEDALLILRKIRSSANIKTLSGFIIYMVNLCSADKVGGSPTAASGTRVSAPQTPPGRCFSCGSPYACSSEKRSFSRISGFGPDGSFRPARILFTENNSSISRSVPAPAVTSPLLAELDKLEFRKAFLILSYLGKNKLEDFVSLDMIRRIGTLQMASFEVELWKAVGCWCISEGDRRKNLDWEPSQTLVYHCHVDPSGAITFKGPFLHSAKTHLQRVVGEENVLVVKFDDVNWTDNRSRCSFMTYNVYQDIARKGITVGLRHYQFFVFKDGGKEEKKKSPSSSPAKCYFVSTESMRDLGKNNIPMSHNRIVSVARTAFMHIHMVPSMAKYMARFSLILSKTFPLNIDLDFVHVERINDVPCRDNDGNVVYNDDGEAMIHTDGTGFISENLALEVPENIFQGQCSSSDGILQRSSNLLFDGNPIHSMKPKYPPLLIQCRLFYNGCAVKGTLLVNKKLPPSTIQIRQSMIKVQADPNISNPRCINSLEIVSTRSDREKSRSKLPEEILTCRRRFRPAGQNFKVSSCVLETNIMTKHHLDLGNVFAVRNEPKKSFLSKNLIALLHYGGVPTEYFLELLRDALEIVQNMYCNKKAAIRALNHGHIGGFLVVKMILSGIPIDEPYLKWRLSTLMKEERMGLKTGKIPVSESFYLMGTADPTGSLGPDEVCIILENGQVSGDVLVYRNLGVHFGDVHILKATYVEDLEKVVGHSKYAIFFPTQGPRSLGDEIAGRDFDGDLYWVSRNPQLLKYFKPSQPWVSNSSKNMQRHPKPSDFSDADLEIQLFQQFLSTRFKPSYAMSVAADSWLSFMDQILTQKADSTEKECLRKKVIQLVDIYYDALDAPKTGKKVEVPSALKAERFPHYMEKARSTTYKSTSVLGLIFDEVASQSYVCPPEDVWRKLPSFCYEPSPASLDFWKVQFSQYKSEMSVALGLCDESKSLAADQIMLKYRKILYGAPEFESSTKSKEKVFDEALAIYHVVFEYANSYKDPGKFNFAWQVAGDALCALHVTKQENNSTTFCLLSVLSELLC